MNAFPNIDMQEVTRLTREGRLKEAMQLLQGGTAEEKPEAAEPTPGTEPAAEKSDRRPTKDRATLDLERPRDGAGGTWTVSGDAASKRPAGAARPKAASAAPVTPPAEPAKPTPASAFSGSSLGQNLWGLVGNAMPDLGGLPGLAPSAPTLAMPDGARFETLSHQGPAGSRDYKLYVPARQNGSPAPLVVMLHGCTQSPDDFAAGTRMNELAEEIGFLVAYPEQTQRANAQRCWNWFEARDQRRDGGEPALIAGITRDIVAEHGVDPQRVFVAGLSAGGAAAAIMGQRYPELFAGVGVHSGLACGAARDMGSAFAAMRAGGPVEAGDAVVPTIVFHGDRDTTVAPVNGDGVIEQARAGAASTAVTSEGVSPGGIAYTRTVHREADGRERLESWRVHGAGHAWSGGSAKGSYTLPAGPDASREMLRFFLAVAD